MLIENSRPAFWAPLMGLVVAGVSLVVIVASGGVGFISFGMSLLLGSYYGFRSYVDAVAISNYNQQLVLTTSRVFSTKVKYFPLQALEARYETRGSLRSPKYSTLKICVGKRKIAEMSPKEGFTASQLDHLYAVIKEISEKAASPK